MTHNIIHDEEKVRDIEQIFWESMPDDITNQRLLYATQIKPHVQNAMKQYAEHILAKTIDAEIERLNEVVMQDKKVRHELPSDTNGFIKIGTIMGKSKAFEDQITHLQSLKPTITEQLVHKDVKELQNSENNLKSLKAQLTKSE